VNPQLRLRIHRQTIKALNVIDLFHPGECYIDIPFKGKLDVGNFAPEFLEKLLDANVDERSCDDIKKTDEPKRKIHHYYTRT